jgi:hypothetical protein
MIAPLINIELFEPVENQKNHVLKLQMDDKGILLYFDNAEAKSEFITGTSFIFFLSCQFTLKNKSW